jgi:site-specific DNA-methyltransferase (adenine-specific)
MLLDMARKKGNRLSQELPSSKWVIGRQTVILADCLTELRTMPSESVDVVVTSPPYNIGVAYRSYRDNRPRRSYLDWLTEIGHQIGRVLKWDGSFFLNVGSTSTDPWVAFDVALAFKDIFTLQNTILWAKSLSIGTDTIGHFKPITSRRFLNNNHESIFHFTKTGDVEIDRLSVGVPFKDKSNIARWGHDADRRCAGNVWFIPYKTVRSKAQKFDHPAGFPAELPARCIKLHGVKGATVLDPFAGTGTTLVAAESLGCNGIGIEIDQQYAEKTVERLRRIQAAPHLLENGTLC